MGKVYNVNFNSGEYKQNDNTRNNDNKQEFRKKYKVREEPLKKPKKKTKLRVKNYENARNRRKEIEKRNTRRKEMQSRVATPRIPKEYYDEEPLRRPRKKKKKIAPRIAAIATSLAVATGGLGVIYKNVTEKNDEVDVTEAMLTMNDKDVIGVNDDILNQASELSYLINRIEELPNTALIKMVEEVSNFESDVLYQKLYSLFGTDVGIGIERGYTSKDGDYIRARVKLDGYSSKTHNVKSSHILPSKVDKYINDMDKFQKIADGIENSDIDRDDLIKRLQEEFEMGKDMLNQMFTINEKGKIKVKPITNEMLWNYRIPEDEER